MLAESLIWFLARWADTYLFVSPDDYARFSTSLGQAFGRSSERAHQLLNHMLELVRQQISLWHGETDVMADVAQLLSVLTHRRAVALAVLQATTWPALLTDILNSLQAFPSEVQRYVLGRDAGAARVVRLMRWLCPARGSTLAAISCVRWPRWRRWVTRPRAKLRTAGRRRCPSRTTCSGCCSMPTAS